MIFKDWYDKNDTIKASIEKHSSHNVVEVEIQGDRARKRKAIKYYRHGSDWRKVEKRRAAEELKYKLDDWD